MRNPYHKSMHRSRVIPVFECIVPTFCQILKIAKALDFTAFQRFNRPIGRTSNKEGPMGLRSRLMGRFLIAPSSTKPDTLAVSGFAIRKSRRGENSRPNQREFGFGCKLKTTPEKRQSRTRQRLRSRSEILDGRISSPGAPAKALRHMKKLKSPSGASAFHEL